MKWLFSLFRIRRGPPPVHELPSLLAKVVVWGAITGPFWAAFFTAFSSPSNALQIFINPFALCWSAVTGIVFALAFFIACGLGNGYLRRIMNGYPPAIITVVAVVYNAVAASLACAVSLEIVSHLPTGINIVIPFLWRIVAIDGVIGAILALIIGAFMKLKYEVEDS